MPDGPRKLMRRRDIAGTARYLTFSCYRRLRLFDNDRIKERFVQHLSVAMTQHTNVSLLAWVIMPEHVHLIVFPEGEQSLTPLLSAVKRPLAMEVLARWRTLDAPILLRLRGRDGQARFWQPGGGYDRNLLSTELLEKIRYVHRNPVARELVAAPIDWRWSSARTYAAEPDAVGPSIAFDLLGMVPEDLT